MKIAVIGAGIAGLTCFRELQSMGHQVELFEKSRGLGGRLATKRMDWGTADIGAQYFTARAPAFVDEVRAWLEQGIVARWEFTPFKLKDGALSESPDSTSRYVGIPGMSQVAHGLADELNIRLNIHIAEARYRHQGWFLTDRANSVHGPYQWVIAAIPAKQASALFSTGSLSGGLTTATLLPCWALVLATTGSVPREIQGVFGDNTVSWLSRLSSKPGRQPPNGCNDLWLLHFDTDWSVSAGRNADQAVADTGIRWLQQTLDTELRVKHMLQHFWRYAKPPAGSQRIGPQVDPTRRLAFVGDWCCGGRVEGAYLSARALIDEHFVRGCLPGPHK